MEDLISVIVPAHNAGRTLEDTCDSILTNSYKNIELLIVENNSTDDTLLIAKKIEHKDNRVRVLITKNEGVSNARNLGLAKSKGEYISFVDADDKVSDDYYISLLNIVNSSDTDFVQCGFCYLWEEKKTNCIDYEIVKDDIALKYFLTGKINGYIWGKIFKRSVIIDNKIYFDINLEIGEDRKFVFLYLNSASNVAISQNELYCYVQNPHSTLNKKFGSNRFNLVTESLFELKYIKNNSNDLNIKLATDNMLREHIRYLIVGTKNKVIDAEKYYYIRNILKSNRFRIAKSKISLTWKIYAFACSICRMETFTFISNVL